MTTTEKLPTNCTLLLIDVQEGLKDSVERPRNNTEAEKQMARLLTAWRSSGRPIVHIQHTSLSPDSNLRPDQPGVAIQSIVAPLPTEPVLQKTVNSAFITTDLKRILEEDIKTKHLVIVGLTTDHCVSTTTRMAGNYGFDTILVEDACGTFAKTGPNGKTYSAQEVHDIHIASLSDEFAKILSTENVLRLV
ncbi:Isochorismatase hydrolase [Fimicolochytrium jonesii]|uniref:Isochorismatase hydrolase n=1 Tax=Fimicolochytrium jonesii TaxID=1396493 RepID=UPI0022FED01C|nr:Isochorismatase hydrolase [Fimicolochytrium jonesii]KAI8827100.1 Isochorismatase hydrolase [Fimicolochytrium jonesii]